jgi:16S rRNA (guanine527-N7)-methyltransferase
LEILRPHLEALGIREPDFVRPTAFHEALYEANRVKNYTRVPAAEAWLRHYLDSLLFVDLIPEGASVLDIGTGPGFPAWPLAWARPDLRVTALDSNGKMLAFLQGQDLPNLEVVQARVEEWDRREAFDFVTGRALAPLPIQLEVSAPAAKVDGWVVPLRTPSDDLGAERLPMLGLERVAVERRELPETDIVRVFPIYRKTARTNPKFPRRWAEIKAQPLSIA